MGDSITEGVLIEWEKKVGDYANVDDIVAVVETDKVSVEIRAEEAGVITQHFAGLEDTIEVGAELFKIDTSAAAPAGGAAAPAPKTESTPSPSKTEAAPAATPPPKAAATPPPKPAEKKPAAPAPSLPTPSSGTSSRTETRQPMSRMRQRIAQRLKESQNENASLTTFNEIDMSNLMKMRKIYGEQFLAKHGVKLGFMSAFIKASVQGLKAQPAINASIEGKEVVYKDYCDISVAVASPTGLVVPVIRDCQNMDFADVEKSIIHYATKAKNNQLTLEDMSGGTFTISNGGIFKNFFGTPIINQPQSAILGMHGVFERPVAIKGEVVVRPMMYVALTYDHRIVDGREAALFLRTIKDCVEDPIRLTLDL